MLLKALCLHCSAALCVWQLQGDELRSTRKECTARATKLQKLSEEKTRASQLAIEADQLKVSTLNTTQSTTASSLYCTQSSSN
jgi:hypothetical protein